MSKILNINDILEAVIDAKLPSCDLRRRQLEWLTQSIANDLAAAFNIEAGPASWRGNDFGGLCADFVPKFLGQPCPKVIEDGDPEGDWGDSEVGIPGEPLCKNRKRRRPFRVWFRSLFLSKEVRQS